MSNGSIIKLTPTNTPNYQIHSSNKSITDQIIQLLQILASASAPPSPISFPTKASKPEQRRTPQDHCRGKGGEPLRSGDFWGGMVFRPRKNRILPLRCDPPNASPEVVYRPRSQSNLQNDITPVARPNLLR